LRLSGFKTILGTR